MHAFSGNGFMSSFFRKSKVHCWKIMKTSDEFEEAFKLLGNSKGCLDTLLDCLEKYASKMYDFSDTGVNRVRFKIFEKKYQEDNKIVDISLLPPFCSTLRLHILRANTIVYLWKQTQNAIIYVPDITTNGWINYDEIKWVEPVFPQEIEILVIDFSSDIDDVFGSYVETDEEY